MVNIKFTANELEVIKSLRAMGEETSRLVDKNLELTKSYAQSDAVAKFWSKGIDRQRKELTLLKGDMSNVATMLLGMQSGIAGSIGGALGGGAGLAIGASIDALISSSRKVSSVTEDYNRLRISLDAATNSTIEGGQAFSFVERLATATGQKVLSLGETYKKLAASAEGTKLEGEGVERIFAAITKRGSELQLSNDQIKGSLKALGDMLNKGKIQAEELTQQFSENFPGGAKLFADALGVSTAELFKLGEQGKLVATEVLPKVADYLEKISKGDYARNLQTTTGSFNNLTNQLDLLIASFGNNVGINSFFASINNGIADTLRNLNLLVKSNSFSSFFASFLGGNTGLYQYNVGVAAGMNAPSQMDIFKGRSREEQMNIIKTQKAIVENAQRDFREGLTGKFKYDEIGATKALEYVRKEEKVFADMISALKAPAKKAADTIGKSEKEKNKELRDALALIKDETAIRLAEIKKASLDVKLPVSAISSIDAYKVRGKGISDIQTGLGNELLASDVITKKFEAEVAKTRRKMLDSIDGMVYDIDTGLTKEIIDLSKIKVIPFSISKELIDASILGIEDFSSLVSGHLTGAMQNLVTNGFSAIKDAIDKKENPFKAFGTTMTQYLGDMMVQMGSVILSTALPVMLGLTATTGGLTAGMATNLALAGAGMMTTGGLLRTVKFADGGIVSGRTFAEIGEYSGARNNPEVVAPLNKLANIFTPYFQKAVDIGARTNQSGFGLQPIMTTTNVYMDGKVFLTQLDRTANRQRRV